MHLNITDGLLIEFLDHLIPFQPTVACISYRNQTFNLPCRSNGWCPHEMQHWTEIGTLRENVYWLIIKMLLQSVLFLREMLEINLKN